MARATYQYHVNDFIEKHGYKIPFTTSRFASEKAIARISNGQQRPARLWHDDNKSYEDQIQLRTLSWVGWLTGWHIDHIVPVSLGGSYNINNLRLLPASLNHMIGKKGGWSHEKINSFLEQLSPSWKKELDIPSFFISCPPQQMFSLLDLTDHETAN